MKKTVAIILVISVLLCALSACAKKPAENEKLSPAQRLYSEFRAEMSENPERSAEKIADELMSAEWIPFQTAVMPVEQGWLNGFTEEIAGFEEGAMFGPAIGAIPFVGYIFIPDAETDAEALAARLRECSDLRWNVCTQADEMVCGEGNGVVFFVMSPADFED